MLLLRSAPNSVQELQRESTNLQNCSFPGSFWSQGQGGCPDFILKTSASSAAQVGKSRMKTAALICRELKSWEQGRQKVESRQKAARRSRGCSQTMLPSVICTFEFAKRRGLLLVTLHLQANIFSTLFPSPHYMQLQWLLICQKKSSSLLSPSPSCWIGGVKWQSGVLTTLWLLLPCHRGIINVTTTATLWYSQAGDA